jgi:hypothetical protein
MRKATIGFVCLSVHPPVRIDQLGFRQADFYEILYLSIFRKSVEKIQFSLNLTRITGNLHEDKHTV